MPKLILFTIGQMVLENNFLLGRRYFLKKSKENQRTYRYLNSEINLFFVFLSEHHGILILNKSHIILNYGVSLLRFGPKQRIITL